MRRFLTLRCSERGIHQPDGDSDTNNITDIGSYPICPLRNVDATATPSPDYRRH